MGEVQPARLRQAREYIGLTCGHAATALRCSPLIIEAMEDGTADPGPEMLEKLGRIYRRPPEWFRGEFKFEPSPGLLRQLESPRLTDGDREAVLDFAEFLAGAGKPEPVHRCKHCNKLVIRCESVSSHAGCSSARGYLHADTRAHGCKPRSDGPYAEPAPVRPSPGIEAGPQPEGSAGG